MATPSQEQIDRVKALVVEKPGIKKCQISVTLKLHTKTCSQIVKRLLDNGEIKTPQEWKAKDPNAHVALYPVDYDYSQIVIEPNPFARDAVQRIVPLDQIYDGIELKPSQNWYRQMLEQRERMAG